MSTLKIWSQTYVVCIFLFEALLTDMHVPTYQRTTAVGLRKPTAGDELPAECISGFLSVCF